MSGSPSVESGEAVGCEADDGEVGAAIDVLAQVVEELGEDLFSGGMGWCVDLARVGGFDAVGVDDEGEAPGAATH
jgi:hypothetical protein